MKQMQNELNGNQRPPNLRLLHVCLLSLFMVMVWAGCKPATKAAADINPVGVYALVSVDGNKVPCTVQHEGHTMAITSGAFAISADGTCSSKMVLPGRDAIEVKATYTREGSKLTMRWQSAGTTIGTVEGDTFTMTNEGMVLAYRK